MAGNDRRLRRRPAFVWFVEGRGRARGRSRHRLRIGDGRGESQGRARRGGGERRNPAPATKRSRRLVSRPVQAGIGLFTGVTVYSIAFGGLFALAFAICYGRMGNWSPRVTAALLALSGFLAVYAVPILKYPANPPSIGNPDTIGLRTAIYFGMILLSLGSMIAAWNVRNRLDRSAWRVERDAGRRRRLSCRGGHLRPCDAPAGRGS